MWCFVYNYGTLPFKLQFQFISPLYDSNSIDFVAFELCYLIFGFGISQKKVDCFKWGMDEYCKI